MASYPNIVFNHYGFGNGWMVSNKFNIFRMSYSYY